MNRPSLYGMLVLHRAIDSIRSPINIYTQRWREIMFITFRLFVKAEMRDTPAPGLTVLFIVQCKLLEIKNDIEI